MTIGILLAMSSTGNIPARGNTKCELWLRNLAGCMAGNEMEEKEARASLLKLMSEKKVLKKKKREKRRKKVIKDVAKLSHQLDC